MTETGWSTETLINWLTDQPGAASGPHVWHCHAARALRWAGWAMLVSSCGMLHSLCIPHKGEMWYGNALCFVPGKASHAHTFPYQLTLKWKQLFPPDNALVWSDCPTIYWHMRVLDMDHVLCCWLINCRPRRKCLAETYTLRGLMFFVVCKQINWTAIIKSFSAN